MALRIEKLSPDQDVGLASSGAELITSEVYDRQVSIAEYLQQWQTGGLEGYGLVESEAGLVAASSFYHDIEAGCTSLVDIAVVPELRNRRYGTILLRFAAVKTMEQGIDAIMLYTEKGSDQERLFMRLGFAWDEDGDYMYANPEQMLE